LISEKIFDIIFKNERLKLLLAKAICNRRYMMAIPKAEQRILDFENMGFGMFIHYGLYSQLGRGE
jgi:hypothetical protein